MNFRHRRVVCCILIGMMLMSLGTGCQRSGQTPAGTGETNPGSTEAPLTTQEDEGTDLGYTEPPQTTQEDEETPTEPSEEQKAIQAILKDSQFFFLDETEPLAPYYDLGIKSLAVCQAGHAQETQEHAQETQKHA